jgi:type I restriction enzyme S subunit
VSQASQVRTYDPAASVVFLKTNERFGGLSNMAPGFPLRVNNVRIRTSEALYQACRFPHMPDVQRKIIDEHSPMTAKMRSKPFRDESRPDWDAARVKIMRWCLRVKLAQNWREFGRLLLATGDRPIVEQSRRDDFWGAKVAQDGSLVGMNVLGRLLMELREQLKSDEAESLRFIEPLPIPEFLLFGQRIEPVQAGPRTEIPGWSNEPPPQTIAVPNFPVEPQPSLFEPPVIADATPPAAVPPADDVEGRKRLKSFSRYRDSGLLWLGEIPEHWDIRRNGRLFGARRETGFPDLPVLEVSIRSGVRVRDFDAGGRKQEMSDRSKYQRAARGDIAYNMMRMWQGAVGIAPVDGLISPAYVVARPFPETDAAYYAYLFRTAAYMREIDVFSRGIVPDRNRLYWESFKRIPSVYPPLDEQRLIVRFLDWHGVQTAKLVRAKKKIIALLNEQKQAIIHRAVTRGLGTNAKLKPSGIPWLGDVPEGWEVLPLKRVTVSRCDGPFGSGLKSSHYTSGGVMVIRLQNIALGAFKVTDPAFIAREHYQSLGDHSVYEDDVLIASLGDERNPCGRACVAPTALGEAMVKADCFRFRLKLNLADPHFVAASLSATAAASSAVLSAGATRQRVNLQSTAERSLALPSVDEQMRIMLHLEAANEEFKPLLDSANREIALIQEFRTRLISDIVTGKLDVRAAAASLPEVTEIEPVDDQAEGDDLDETMDATENEEVAA